MSFFNVNPTDPTHRVEPIGERPEDKDSRRRFAKHKGRKWEEKDEESSPSKIQTIPRYDPERKKQEPLWEKSQHAKKARELFETLTTLEEKVAQLVFLTTTACYDPTIQRGIELLIQTWQIGGILFTAGEFKREAYLTEKFNEVSKTPLLFANDFFHGLSFYFGEEAEGLVYPQDVEKRFSDLGKAVVGINKRLGIHIQLTAQRGAKKVKFSEKQYAAFRHGVRSAGGLVGKEYPDEKGTTYSVKNMQPLSVKQTVSTMDLSSIARQPSAQEFIGVRTLNFLDLTEEEIYAEKLIKFIKEPYDALILNDRADEVILQICRAIKTGRVSEKDLDQKVLKLLYFKVMQQAP
jgi:hypothetical protein